jgi:hypothetical protein
VPSAGETAARAVEPQAAPVQVEPAPAPPAVGDETADSGSLLWTGLEIVGLAVIGLGALTLGVALSPRRRERRSDLR